MIFEVDSADVAFAKLQELCVTQSSADLSAGAERDAACRILRIEIPWDRTGHRANVALPNTLLGRVMIDGQQMTAEVNSAERALALRREIETRMGNAARFKVDEIEDPEAVMASGGADGTGGPKRYTEQEDLTQLPEVQEQLNQFITEH